MLCTDCSHVNLPGASQCDTCGQDMLDIQSTMTSEGLEIQEEIMTAPISDLLRDETNQSILPDTTLSEAINRMRSVKANMGCLLVVDEDGTFQGILTERDILIHIGDSPVCLDTTLVKDIYSKNRPVLSLDNSLNYAVHQMSISGYRHLAITRGNEVVGFINVKDILGYICKEIKAL